jgi:hypothetical protein
MNNSIIACGLSVVLCGCAQSPEYRLGQFTVASSYNVANLDYDRDSATRVMAEDCHPVSRTPNDSRVQRAMDKAIAKGHKKGNDGNLLINVRVDQVEKYKPGPLGLPTRNNCIEVEGDLVAAE